MLQLNGVASDVFESSPVTAMMISLVFVSGGNWANALGFQDRLLIPPFIVPGVRRNHKIATRREVPPTAM